MPKPADILSVRDASRRMVRDLGFMKPTLAETDLSLSAVHAVIEIGSQDGMTASRLGQILRLEKSSVSRMLLRLVERGLVAETADIADSRSKRLSLTGKGRALYADIDRFANGKVERALMTLDTASIARVVGGLETYATALETARGLPSGSRNARYEIIEGYVPGMIGRIVEMHGRYYAREWGFPPVFEAKIAGGLAEFVPRLDRPVNQVWLAVSNGEIKGSIAIDGEDLGDGKAHLRWVIVDDGLRGSGAGRLLVTRAVEFCDRQGFAEIHLWTFRGLDTARRLYESAGFALAEEWQGTQWGFDLPEQRFVRRAG